MNTHFYFDNMKRIILLSLLCVAALAACDDGSGVNYGSVVELPEDPIVEKPVYTYIWARPHTPDTSANLPRVMFKTYDCSLPLFDNGQKVIVGNVNGGLNCLETDSGSVVWSCRLFDTPDEALTNPIVDYIIASTDEWMVINIDSTEFIKIDLKMGNVLGRCQMPVKVTSRMTKDGDDCFYVTAKEQVYKVTLNNMECTLFSFNGEFRDDIKLYPFPYSRNNEKYYFIHEIIKYPIQNIYFYRGYVYLVNTIGDTLYSIKIQDDFEDNPFLIAPTYVTHIDEHDGEVYLFTRKSYIYRFLVFNWDSMKVVCKDIILNNLSRKFRYHEFDNDALIYHMGYSKELEHEGYIGEYMIIDTKARKYRRKITDRPCGTKTFDGFSYVAKDHCFSVRECYSDYEYFRVPLNGMVSVSENNDRTYDSYEITISKKTNGNEFVVFASETMIYCFPTVYLKEGRLKF